MQPTVLSLLLVASLLFSCAGTGSGTDALDDAPFVEGSVTYRERMALPPDAVLHVALHDLGLGRGEVPSTLARAAIPMEGRSVPFPFRLPFDGERVGPGSMPVLTATIQSGEGVLFGTPAPVRVLTDGAPDTVDLLLRRGAAPATPALVGTYWRLVELDGAPVEVGDGRPLPWVLLEDSGAYMGHGGVNRFRGQYRLEDDQPVLEPGPMTLMAWDPEAMARERAFVQALAAAETWGAEGDELVLTAAGRRVARLVAVCPS